MVHSTEKAEAAIGGISYEMGEKESENKVFKRSIL